MGTEALKSEELKDHSRKGVSPVYLCVKRTLDFICSLLALIVLSPLILILREIKESDAQQLVKWRSDPEVYKYFTIPRKLTVEDHLNWYRNSYVSDANRIDLIALERVEQNAVGVFGIKKKIEGSCVEISYLVDPQYQSRGYAREAMIALMCFAKEKWGCETVMAEIHRDNISSILFAERLGFTDEKKESEFVVMKRML